MMRDNPGRPVELCTAVVDGIWDKKRKMNKAMIPDRFKNADVGDLGYLESLILDSVQDIFSDPSESEKIGIVLTGMAGCGKTHAVCAVVNKINEQNPEMFSCFISYTEAFDELRRDFSSGNNYDDVGLMWDKMTNTSGLYGGLLVIDDVSSKNLTDFEMNKLLMILDRRFNYYMPFILTTNIAPEDFKEVFGERISSRLFGYCEIFPLTDDKRIKA